MNGKAKVGLFGVTIVGAAVAYLAILRPRLNRWGATDREVEMHLPGDELTSPGAQRITHVIDIDADVEQVWPWLLQIGQGRGGFYSYTWLENLLGSNIRNVASISRQFQDLREGDTIFLHPKAPPLQVVDLDPPNNIVLSAKEPVKLRLDGVLDTFVWSFHLRPHGRGSCRLIARLRANWEPNLRHSLSAVLLEPGHFLFERKMMLTIKALAERAQQADQHPLSRQRPTML